MITDQYCEGIRAIAKTGDVARCCEAIASFYDRMYWRKCSVEIINTHPNGIEVKVDDEMWLYDQGRNRWCAGLAGHVAQLAEILGCPVAWIEGMTWALMELPEIQRQTIRERHQVHYEMQAARSTRRRLDDKIKTLEESDVVRALKSKHERRSEKLQEEILRLRQLGIGTRGHPQVPLASIQVTAKGEGLPESPGVYFVWRDDSIVYIGQSINIRQRVTISHPHIERGDRLSWLPFPRPALLYAEGFYIGIYTPERNARR